MIKAIFRSFIPTYILSLIYFYLSDTLVFALIFIPSFFIEFYVTSKIINKKIIFSYKTISRFIPLIIFTTSMLLFFLKDVIYLNYPLIFLIAFICIAVYIPLLLDELYKIRFFIRFFPHINEKLSYIKDSDFNFAILCKKNNRYFFDFGKFSIGGSNNFDFNLFIKNDKNYKYNNEKIVSLLETLGKDNIFQLNNDDIEIFKMMEI